MSQPQRDAIKMHRPAHKWRLLLHNLHSRWPSLLGHKPAFGRSGQIFARWQPSDSRAPLLAPTKRHIWAQVNETSVRLVRWCSSGALEGTPSWSTPTHVREMSRSCLMGPCLRQGEPIWKRRVHNIQCASSISEHVNRACEVVFWKKRDTSSLVGLIY
jgi:hypothetical protein